MFRKEEKGIAFLVVLGIVSVMITLMIGLLLLLKFEARMALNFRRSVQAAYITEAGFEHAKLVLKKDAPLSLITDYSQNWRVFFQGDDVDNDGDGVKDSRWIDFKDRDGNIAGRYAVLIKDENSKVNINTAGVLETDDLKISLIKFFNILSLSGDSNDIKNKALSICQNQPYLTLSQILNSQGITPGDYAGIKNFASVYSADLNTTLSGELKLCLNELNKDELYDFLKNNDVEGAAQMAVNIADFCDADLNQTEIKEDEKTYYGSEAVKINEIMVKPSLLKEVTDEGPKGYWEFIDNRYQSGKLGSSAVWEWDGIRNGTYYVKVFAAGSNQVVGDVTINAVVQTSMKHAEMFDVPVTIDNEKLTVKIQNNEEKQDGEPVICYFKSLWLIQEPDGEFIELVNMSGGQIDLSNFSITGSALSDEIDALIIPEGTLIEPKAFLTLAVDACDNQTGIENNKISFRDIWNKEFRVVNLEINKALEPCFDCISNQGGELFLKNSEGKIVDRAEFFPSHVQNYVSLEKDDPSYFRDDNENNICDFWNLSLDEDGATPGEENINYGMELHSVFHIAFNNGDFKRAGEILNVPSSKGSWQTFTIDDTREIVDKICVEFLRFEAENHLAGESKWLLEENDYISQEPLELGEWNWEVPNGTYLLNIYGHEGETLDVSSDGENFFEFIPDDKGRVSFGRVKITDNLLKLFLINKSPSETARFDYITLSPKIRVDGRININTAGREVLLSLPSMDDKRVTRIFNERPFGNKNDLVTGIGDLLHYDIIGDSDGEKKWRFIEISNLITTRSDIFEIIVTGEKLIKGNSAGEKKLRSVFER